MDNNPDQNSTNLPQNEGNPEPVGQDGLNPSDSLNEKFNRERANREASARETVRAAEAREAEERATNARQTIGRNFITDAASNRKLSGGLIDLGYRKAQAYSARKELEGLREREQTIAGFLNQEQTIINSQIANLGLENKITVSNARVIDFGRQIRELEEALNVPGALTPENEADCREQLEKGKDSLEEQQRILISSQGILEDLQQTARFGAEMYAGEQMFLQQTITYKDIELKLLGYSRKELEKIASGASPTGQTLVNFVADRWDSLLSIDSAWQERHKRRHPNGIPIDTEGGEGEETGDELGNGNEIVELPNLEETLPDFEINEHSPDDIEQRFYKGSVNGDQFEGYLIFDKNHPDHNIGYIELKLLKNDFAEHDDLPQLINHITGWLIGELEGKGYFTETNKGTWENKMYDLASMIVKNAKGHTGEEETDDQSLPEKKDIEADGGDIEEKNNTLIDGNQDKLPPVPEEKEDSPKEVYQKWLKMVESKKILKEEFSTISREENDESTAEDRKNELKIRGIEIMKKIYSLDKELLLLQTKVIESLESFDELDKMLKISDNTLLGEIKDNPYPYNHSGLGREIGKTREENTVNLFTSDVPGLELKIKELAINEKAGQPAEESG